jgi:hypothetical protein
MQCFNKKSLKLRLLRRFCDMGRQKKFTKNLTIIEKFGVKLAQQGGFFEDRCSN